MKGAIESELYALQCASQLVNSACLWLTPKCYSCRSLLCKHSAEMKGDGVIWCKDMDCPRVRELYGLCTTTGIIFEYDEYDDDDDDDDDANDDDDDANDDDDDNYDDANDDDDDDGDDDGDNDESNNNDTDNNDDEENDDNDDDNNDDDDENDNNDDDEAVHNACSRRISCATQECFNNDSPNVLTFSYCVTLHPKL